MSARNFEKTLKVCHEIGELASKALDDCKRYSVLTKKYNRAFNQASYYCAVHGRLCTELGVLLDEEKKGLEKC